MKNEIKQQAQKWALYGGIALLPALLFGLMFEFSDESIPREEIFVADHGLSRADLDQSLELGTKFLLNNQKEEGNFNYEYDFEEKSLSEDDNQVRQAGALWGLTLIYKDQPSEELQKAIIESLAFFDENSVEKEDFKYVTYPGESRGKTGTMALVSLSLIEFLSSGEEIENRAKYEEDLEKYMHFLMSLQGDDYLFAGGYRFENGEALGAPSPYSDGEALLAMAKAYKQLGMSEYRRIMVKTADKMYEQYAMEAITKKLDEDKLKGFFQWGVMAFYEIFTSNVMGNERFADRSIKMGLWMTDVHKTLNRKRNTAYAYEGVVLAWELARLTGDVEALMRFERVIDVGLYRLTSWQVGHDLANDFLTEGFETSDPLALGGVMNAEDEPILRIDVTQHQMHAVILARKFVYR